jgi:hypothetical protein
LVSVPILRGGVYMITGGTSTDATGTNFTNLQMQFGSSNTAGGSPIGPLSSYDGELEFYHEFTETGFLNVVALAADGTVVYHVDNFTATRIGPIGSMIDDTSINQIR